MNMMTKTKTSFNENIGQRVATKMCFRYPLPLLIKPKNYKLHFLKIYEKAYTSVFKKMNIMTKTKTSFNENIGQIVATKMCFRYPLPLLIKPKKDKLNFLKICEKSLYISI